MQSPTENWQAMVAWTSGSFELFLQAQAAQGRTRKQALALLKRSWQIDDEDKLKGMAEAARLISRAR